MSTQYRPYLKCPHCGANAVYMVVENLASRYECHGCGAAFMHRTREQNQQLLREVQAGIDRSRFRSDD